MLEQRAPRLNAKRTVCPGVDCSCRKSWHGAACCQLQPSAVDAVVTMIQEPVCGTQVQQEAGKNSTLHVSLTGIGGIHFKGARGLAPRFRQFFFSAKSWRSQQHSYVSGSNVGGRRPAWGKLAGWPGALRILAGCPTPWLAPRRARPLRRIAACPASYIGWTVMCSAPIAHKCALHLRIGHGSAAPRKNCTHTRNPPSSVCHHVQQRRDEGKPHSSC